MRVYLLVTLIAALVTFLLTPLVRKFAIKAGAVTAVRERDVHTIPTPRLGGIALWAGMCAATVLASQIPFLQGLFEVNDGAWVILIAGAMVCLLGVADDIWDLDWMTKLAGQILAAGFMAWQGVQFTTLPIGGLTIGSSWTFLIITVFIVVLTMNAVNFVDGLDGLAAGVVAIGGGGFFMYTYLLAKGSSPSDYSSLASLVIAGLIGACLGFLPHNYHRARIFMGDSGSMLIGLTMSASTILVTGQIDPESVPSGGGIPAFIPILLPLAVIVIPLLDMFLAVVRRVKAGNSPFHPDKLHIHHRLLSLGHSHQNTVLIMYGWSAIFAFGAASLVVLQWWQSAIFVSVAVLVALVITFFPTFKSMRKWSENV